MNHEALRRKALAMGAKLEIDGKVFNAARVEGTHAPKVVPIKPLHKQPEISVPAPIETAQHSDEYIAASLALVDKQSQILDSNAKLIALMTHQLTKPEAKKSKGWIFKINKDSNGNMTSIEATPKD
jgi:hypothetical protein